MNHRPRTPSRIALRFDVQIPSGARMISLVAMDAGDGSREDFGDCANAGSITQR